MTDGASTGIDGKLTDHVSLGVLTRVVPRYIVDEVLAETGSKEKRSRSLPTHLVVYFVRNWSRQFVVGSHGRPSASVTRVSKNCLPCLAAVER
jgi:hypothetical protein